MVRQRQVAIATRELSFYIFAQIREVSASLFCVGKILKNPLLFVDIIYLWVYNKDVRKSETNKEDKTMKEFTKKDLLRYLQSQMDDFKNEEAIYGIEERGVQHKLDAMIACKEMVEALIQEPVNLQKNGIVTVGF